MNTQKNKPFFDDESCLMQRYPKLKLYWEIKDRELSVGNIKTVHTAPI